MSFIKLDYLSIYIYIHLLIMTKRTLSNKTRYSILKVSGFRSRMLNSQGRKILKNRRKKGRYKLTIQH